LRDQAPLVAIVHTAPPTVFKKSIEGFTPRPDDFQDFGEMSLGGGH